MSAPKMVQKKDEKRIDYLMRVLEEFMFHIDHIDIEYDEAICDGFCLAIDIKNEILLMDAAPPKGE